MRSESRPTLRCVHLAVPKEAEHPQDIEDACAFDEAVGIVVVVDGASTGFDPVNWSRTLAASALLSVRELGEISVGAIATRARQRWLQRPPPSLPPGIIETPTGATLGVVHASPIRGGVMLDGQFVGDVNLMIDQPGRPPVVPGDLCRSSDYGSAPETLNSQLRRVVGVRVLESIPLQSGDVFFVFTDGFGKWLIERAGLSPINDHLREMDPLSFESLVRTEQMAGRMDLDDVTFVRCVVV